MLESRWGRRSAMGFGALGAIFAIASTTLGAPAVEGRAPPPCDRAVEVAEPRGIAWSRLDPVLEAGGLVGQRLEAGRTSGPSWSLSLDPESFITGPVDGRVVVGTDDGRRSTISIVDMVRGCLEPTATSTDVIRRAVLSPDGRTLVEHRIRRADRTDLGIWHRSLSAGEPTRLLPPIEPDARFGRTWSTDLGWSADGRRLVVSTCGEVACRYRALDLGTGATVRVADPELGPLVGAADDRIVVRGACPGRPCPVIVVDLRDGGRRVVEEAAGVAALATRADGRAGVVVDDDRADTRRFVPLDGGATVALPRDPAMTPLAPFGDSVVDLPPGWFGLGLGGRLPDDPGDGARAQRLSDGTTRALDEVIP